MKIAVLSDIHGNLPALEAVLKDAERNGASDFIIAGDHVGDGPQPKEVLERIKELRAWIIKGNREEYAISYADGLHKDWNDNNQMYVAVWTSKCLNRSEIEYLRNLPEQIVVDIPGTMPIRVVHGSPFDMRELIYLDKDIERLESIVKNISEPVLVCGHSHEAWSRKVGEKLAVNPGSLGMYFSDKGVCAEYSILSWNGSQWEEEHRYVSYDVDKVEKAFEGSGLYETGGAVWAKCALCSIKTGRNLMMEFLKFAREFAAKEGLEDKKLIPNDLWDKAAEVWFQC